MSKSPSKGWYGSPTDHDTGTRLRKEQGYRRVSAAIRRSFEMSVSPRDREPGPLRRVYHRGGGGHG